MAEETQRNRNILSIQLYGCRYNSLGCFVKRDRVNEKLRCDYTQEEINKIAENICFKE
jgi:hypothetical protein